MVIRAGLSTLVCVLALAACGGDDSSSGTSTSTPGATAQAATTAGAATTAAATAPQPTADLDGVLRCLQAAGLEAKEQSGLDDKRLIGIDYPGGRTTIDFPKDADEADLTASAAEQYGEVVRSGLVVATIDPSGAADKATVTGCLDPARAPAATTGAAAGAVAADAPALEDVRRCLAAAGVPSRDTANVATPGTIEIAHVDKSLTVIDFEADEEEAKLTAKVSEDYGKVLRVGTVVATMSKSGERVEDKIRPCLSK